MENASSNQRGQTLLSDEDLAGIDGGMTLNPILVGILLAIAYSFDYDSFRAGFNEGYSH